jgi:hypothetical protein
VILYPNPTKGIINLNCVLCDSDQLEIFNSDGSDVLSEVELKSTESGYLMDLMSLPNGIYYLHVRTDAEIIVKRFTVMH